MDHFILGRTNLKISRTGFGALPIQRISFEEASDILNRALDGGISFIDTARAYSNSEEKIGKAISHRRDEFVLATKSHIKDPATLNANLETSLRMLNTDHIDLYQFHMSAYMPKPGGEDGAYDVMLKAREAGKILNIGITTHSLECAFEAVNSGLYDTLQYPFNHLATQQEIDLVNLCKEKNVGFIAMKGMSGGLVTNAALPFTFIRQFDNVVPIWGIQRMSELEQFLSLSENPPSMNEEMQAQIADDRKALAGSFCRGCGYCLPCPANIPIDTANRLSYLLERSPWKPYMNDEWEEKMNRIDDCIQCGACASRCPYGLKPYETLPAQRDFFREFLKKHRDD